VIITSRDNPLVKLLRSLRLRDHRQSERAFVVEGRRAVRDAIQAGGALRWLVASEGQAAEFAQVSPEQFRVVDGKLFDFIASTESPQGVLGVFEMPELPIPERENPLYVMLDAIADPGNLGTIIRTCAAAGVDALVLLPGCVDPFNSKAVRSAMGAHFRVPLRALGVDQAVGFAKRTPQRVVSDGGAGRTYDEIDWTVPSTLIIGSEAHGASPAVAELATLSAAIPMSGGVESLNAAVATSVFVFEARRQRIAASRASDGGQASS
jgi:TrmH family RNA methyltransferase